jgi:hypothetical protein
MNELLSRGMCLTPPFDRAPSVCNQNDKTHLDGYFNEQFRFEYFDWALNHLHKPENLTRVHLDRLSRFAHCNHSIDAANMKPLVDYDAQLNMRRNRRLLLRSTTRDVGGGGGKTINRHVPETMMYQHQGVVRPDLLLGSYNREVRPDLLLETYNRVVSNVISTETPFCQLELYFVVVVILIIIFRIRRK